MVYVLINVIVNVIGCFVYDILKKHTYRIIRKRQEKNAASAKDQRS